MMAEATAERDADIQHQATATAADDEERQSGNFHMTPATGGAVSENYYIALEGLGEDAGTEDSGGVYLRPPTSRVRSNRVKRDNEAGRRNGVDQADN